MKTIYKYPIEVTDKQTIMIPLGAKILAVQMQSIYSHEKQRLEEQPRIWALVDFESKPVARKFRVFGTGQPFEAGPHVYIGTFQMHSGGLVFHLFEEM